jgi:hypothetical protein
LQRKIAKGWLPWSDIIQILLRGSVVVEKFVVSKRNRVVFSVTLCDQTESNRYSSYECRLEVEAAPYSSL